MSSYKMYLMAFVRHQGLGRNKMLCTYGNQNCDFLEARIHPYSNCEFLEAKTHPANIFEVIGNYLALHLFRFPILILSSS